MSKPNEMGAGRLRHATPSPASSPSPVEELRELTHRLAGCAWIMREQAEIGPKTKASIADALDLAASELVGLREENERLKGSSPQTARPQVQDGERKALYWRKKPVAVRAWQYDPEKLFPEWLQAAYVNETVWFDGDSLAIKTLEGIVRAKLGDWVIEGVEGELYPCRRDIFAATYEQDAAVAEAEQVRTPSEASATSPSSSGLEDKTP